MLSTQLHTLNLAKKIHVSLKVTPPPVLSATQCPLTSANVPDTASTLTGDAQADAISNVQPDKSTRLVALLVHKHAGINHTTAMMIIALMVAIAQKDNTSMTASVSSDTSAHVSSAVKYLIHDPESDVTVTNASVSMVAGCVLRTNATEFALPSLLTTLHSTVSTSISMANAHMYLPEAKLVICHSKF
jgi:hypothetical protein